MREILPEWGRLPEVGKYSREGEILPTMARWGGAPRALHAVCGPAWVRLHTGPQGAPRAA